jgi:toxin FitB
MHLSVLTLAEYDKGIANLPEGDGRRGLYGARRNALEARFAGRVLSLSDKVVRRWGVISGHVRRLTGHPPPVIDTLLAATAIEHRLWLVTRNVRDVQSSGAAVFDPWNDEPPS